MIDFMFEIPKNCWGWAPRATDPFPALSRIFLSIRASSDADPQLLTRGCLISYHACMGTRFANVNV